MRAEHPDDRLCRAGGCQCPDQRLRAMGVQGALGGVALGPGVAVGEVVCQRPRRWQGGHKVMPDIPRCPRFGCCDTEWRVEVEQATRTTGAAARQARWAWLRCVP